jgi:hypothetical protein
MTYMPSSTSNQTAANVASLTILHNSSTDIAISAGSVVPLGSSIQSHGSDSYTVSSGVITLPIGSSYLVRAALASYGPTVTGDQITYQLYNTGGSAYVGRRGNLVWQESPKLNGGDEYAIALIDALSSSQTIDCRVLTTSSAGFVMDPSGATHAQYTYAGRTRIEIWRFS